MGAPGIDVSARAKPGNRITISDIKALLPAAAMRTRRGPTKWAVKLLNGGRDFRKEFGGNWGDEPGPYGARFFSQLAVVRLLGSSAKRGSRRILNYLDGSTLLAAQPNEGAWGGEVSGSVTKWSTTTTASANNAPGTVLSSTTAIGLASLVGVEVGDSVYVIDSSGNRVAAVICALDTTTGEARIFTKAGWASGTCVLGATIASSTYHLGNTTSTQALTTGATSLTLNSTRGFVKGAECMVIHQSAPYSNEPVDLGAITGVTAEGITFAAYAGGTTFPTGSIVVSNEWYATVTERNSDDSDYVETLGPLSMSSTYKGLYVGDVAGTSIAFAAGSAMAETTAANIASNDAQVTVSSGAAFNVGDWYKFGTGLIAQVKSKSGAVLYIDRVGVLGATITSGAACYPVTVTWNDSKESKSKLWFLQECIASGTGEDTAIPSFLRIPQPVAIAAMTGGADGSAPLHGSSQVMGSATPGAKTGIRAFEDADFLTEIVALAVPGVDSGTAALRAALDVAVNTWCRDNKIHFLSSAPTDITTPAAAKHYRLRTLGLDSEDAGMWFPRLKVLSLTDGAPNVVMPPDMDNLLNLVTVAGGDDISEPAAGANKPYGAHVKGTDLVFTTAERGELDDVGVNCIVADLDGTVYAMGNDTLYRARNDKTKLHHGNASLTLKYILKSLQASLKGFPFTAGNLDALRDLNDAVNEYLRNQPSKRFERSGSYAKVDEQTTTDADIAAGDAVLELHLLLAGAWKRVLVKPYLYTGGVTLRRAA